MGFKGCIRELETENKDLRENPVDLMILGDTEFTDPRRVFHRVKKCGCKDKDLECQNLGNCQERPPDYRCQCKLGYTGPQCQILGEYDLKFCGWRLMKTPKETFCYGRASRGGVSKLVGKRERVGKLIPVIILQSLKAVI